MFTELVLEPHLEAHSGDRPGARPGARLAQDTGRFRFSSSVEGPLVVDAIDWRTALCLGLQLLEREEVVSRLRLARRGDTITALDPWTAETFSVERIGARQVICSAA